MNTIIQNMLNRRSIRKYIPEQVAEETLTQIITAGLYAPCAGGRQSVKFLVCQDSEINIRLGRINRNAFTGRKASSNVYISKDQPSIADDDTMQDGFYGAPTVITIFAPKDFGYSVFDSCVAAENMMLAAWSLDIGSCMVGRAKETFDNAEGAALMREYGLDEASIPLTLPQSIRYYSVEYIRSWVSSLVRSSCPAGLNLKWLSPAFLCIAGSK